MPFQVDLLFVIDSSPGAAPHRARLLEGYRRFIEVLEGFHGGAPDLHLGVVTADVGTRGAYEPGPGPSIGAGPGACSSEGDRGELRRIAPAGGTFLVDVARPDGARARNYEGSLADAFSRLADVGAAGCAYARPLEAMRRALENPANAGFRRERALLAVALIASGDDCSFGNASFIGGVLDPARCTANAGSLVEVGDYVASLQAAADDPDRVMVLGAFAPPGGPACADAAPAARLAAFLGGLPGHVHAVSICEPDLGGLMAPIGRTHLRSLAAPCFSAPLLDTDPAAEGLQPQCAAWYSYRDGDAHIEEIVPPCRGDAPGSCWQIRHDPRICTSWGELLELRGPRRAFGEGSHPRSIVECASR
jgi:hypothetical protein